MKRSVLLLACLLPVLGFSDPMMKEWEARYVRLSKLITTRNLVRFKALVAEELVWVLADGQQLKRSESIAAFAPIFKATKITGAEKVLKVKVRGELVDVTYEGNFILTYAGKKPQKFHENGVDTWKKIKGKWQFVKSVTEPEPK